MTDPQAPATAATTEPAPPAEPAPAPPYVAPLRNRYLGLEPLLDAPVRTRSRRR